MAKIFAAVSFTLLVSAIIGIMYLDKTINYHIKTGIINYHGEKYVVRHEVELGIK